MKYFLVLIAVTALALTLILVPVLAVDNECRRLGFDNGGYTRFLGEPICIKHVFCGLEDVKNGSCDIAGTLK